MKKTILILGIIFLLIGVNVESSSDSGLKENSFNLYISESLEFQEKSSSRGKIAYAYNTYSSGISEGLVKFDLDDPENISLLAPTVSGDFLSGGTWANGYGWLAVEYGSGVLWEIDPYTGDMYSIGGGGQSLRDLAWDDYTWKLYGIGNSNYFFEIDPETGASFLIDSNNTVDIVSFAFNSQGICYGIDSITDSLHIINISTGDVTFIANLSISLDYYINYISFDKDNDFLYLLTDSLYICNTENGECTFIGSFWGLQLTAFAIPYNCLGPTADFTWEPLVAEPYIPVNFNASDSYDPDGYITLYEWDWDDDGIYDENHTGPNATHIWEEADEFPVTLRVTDNDGLIGMKTKYVLVYKEPLTPPSITGPTSGKVGVTYEYEFVQVNPDGDDISYFIDWGDNTTTGWTDYYTSGEWITRNHTWYEKGDYEIIAKVKDCYGGESPWSMLKVTMPRDKSIQNILFLQYLERFPLLSLLLQRLLLL